MRILTKGELLLALGDSANNFTSFMISPEQFGVTEPTLTTIKVVKQKLDWTSSIDVGLPEIQELIDLLQGLGVVALEDANTVRNTPDNAEYDQYLIYVKAQDIITASNAYGAVFDGNAWKVVIDYYNVTKNTHVMEDAYFSSEPNIEEINITINNRILEMKRG